MSVSHDISDGVAVITMDDGKANAVTHDLIAALNAALDEAEAASAAVVLAGRQGRFSGGFDLKVMQGATMEEITALVANGGRLAHRLYGFPAPVVGAVNGHAVAMGAMILFSLDTRIGPRGDFRFGLNETAIGMPMPPFGLTLAMARLAPTAFTRSIVQAHLFNPEEAVEAGLLDEVVELDQVVARATEVAGALAALPREAYAANKQLLRGPTLELTRPQ